MDVLLFLGALLLLVIGGVVVLRRAERKKDMGRSSHNSVYHPSHTRRTKRHHAVDNLVHSHSTSRMQVHNSNDLWRSSRVKVNEEHLETGTFVANKVLTDSELGSSGREENHGAQMPSIKYEPVEIKKRPARIVGVKGGKT